MSTRRRSENAFREMQRELALAVGVGHLDRDEATKELGRAYDKKWTVGKDAANRNAHEYRERHRGE